MLIKEYRIPLPLTLEEYKIAQLYMIQKKSREESEGHESGVEIIENHPYRDGPFGSGQYTYKVYHIGRHIPGWLRSMTPKTALEVHEESWNAYPRTRTKFSVPFVEKFTLEIDTVFQPDDGTQENVFNLSRSELRNRELDIIDIVSDNLTGSDYKEEEDPSLYQSSKTGRGPLDFNWIKNPPNGTIMCSYKLIKVEFRYWGLQSRIERLIHDYALRRVMLRAHRQAWAWQDEWVGLTIEDIRRLELETKLILQRKFGRSEEVDDEGIGEFVENKEIVSEGSVNDHNRLTRQLTQSSYRDSIPLDNVAKRKSEAELSHYCPLDSIAIDDSDAEEFFDAKEAISDDEEYNDPLVDITLSDIGLITEQSSTPLKEEPKGPTPPSNDSLILVVCGGWGMGRGLGNHDDEINQATLEATFEEVYATHYSNNRGRVHIRFVSCPDVTTPYSDLISSLRCSSFDNLPIDHTPLSLIPLFVTEDPLYLYHLKELVEMCNSSYRKFLASDEGRGFAGTVSVLGDCVGSILIYDILRDQKRPSPSGLKYAKSLSLDGDKSDTGKSRSSSDPLPCDDTAQDMALMFDVTRLFMFGSPLALVLSLRGIRIGPPAYIEPGGVSIYNLFYTADPLGFRIEPLLEPVFSSIDPFVIPSYMRYPTGDQSSTTLTDTVASHPRFFSPTHQLLPSDETSSRGSIEHKGIRKWWGNERIDYVLEAPPYVEQLKSLPKTSYAHVMQARYWEAKELVSFVLRQVLHGAGVGGASILMAPAGFWVSFIPPTSVVKWNKRKTPLRIQRMSPNHRAVDVVSVLSSPRHVTLQAKFTYGPLNMATLSGELVDLYILLEKDRSKEAEDKDEGGRSDLSLNRNWIYIDELKTDKHGRITYDLIIDQHISKPGVYPLMCLVKGDHTVASSNLFVLPPHTEAVVFSIDGALCSNFSLSGRDLKIKECSVDVARLWQKMGYLVIYITGRPILQKEDIISWLAFHKFPLGVVSFSDTLSTDSHSIKLLYLGRLMKEAKVILCAAYCSHRHLSVYKDLGLQPDQIYIHGKTSSGKKLSTGTSSRNKEECQLITDGFASHLLTLSVRPAAVDMNEIIGRMDFGYSAINDNFDGSPKHISPFPSPRISKIAVVN